MYSISNLEHKKPNEKSVWHTLYKIDMPEKPSWWLVWCNLKEVYPNATYKKHTFNGLPFIEDSRGYAYVKVTVGIPSDNGSRSVKVTEIMPVYDELKQPVKNPTSADVSRSLHLCLIKAIADLGLGRDIYDY